MLIIDEHFVRDDKVGVMPYPRLKTVHLWYSIQSFKWI